ELAKQVREKTTVIQERVDELSKQVDKKTAVIQDQVDELTKQVQALRQQVQFLEKSQIIWSKELDDFRAQKRATALEPAAQKAEVFIFTLKNADASELSATLRQLLQDDAKGASKKLRIATHESTNSLLVQGTREDRETIETIVRQLDNLPHKK